MTTRTRPRETVAQAIARYAPTQRIAEAMGLGALMEGGTLGSGPFNVGDFGHSFGPFQENDMYHNYNHKKITNPDYAVQYILPAYEAAAKRVPQQLWNTNPERAAELTAFYAERPAKDYYQTEDVHAKWQQLQHGGKPVLIHGKVNTMSGGTFFGNSIGGFSVTMILAILLVVLVIKGR